jgi:hypothetical protein
MMRARRLTLTVLGVLAGGLVFSSAPAPAATVHLFSGSFGSTTSTPPDPAPLSAPSGAAVSDSTGDVYVLDKGNNRVEQFSATGTFIAGWGWGVSNGNAEYQICTSGCQAGIEGSGAGQLDSPEAIAVDNSGKTVSEDPSVGDVYVTNTADRVIDKFSASGAYLGQIATGEGGAAFSGLDGVAVGAEGKVWVYQESKEIDDYSDALVNIFLPPTPSRASHAEGAVNPGFAVDSEDNLYVVHKVRRIVAKLNSAGEVLEGVEELGGEGPKTGIAIDLANNDVYLDMDQEEGGPTKDVEQFAANGSLVETFGAEQLTDGGGSGLAVDSASGTVYVADSVANVVDIFAPVVLPDVTTGAPSNLQPQTGSATLNGAVNPLEGEAKSEAQGIEFEYGLSTAYELGVVVASPAEAAGNSEVAVTAKVSGLELNTVYDYRLNATNATGRINHSPNATFTISVSPAVDDQPATVTDVGRASAVFQGTVNPENSETFYHFAYVPAGEYQPGASNPYATGGATEEVSVPAELGDETVGPVPAGDLLPGTTYHYALVASNTAGSSIGEDHTFTTTPGTPPVATTGGASAISQNAATLSGTVSTNGRPTNYGFEIGTEAGNYGPATGLGSLGGATTETVTLTLGELQPGTTYHYRITATSSDGASYGADQTFTTPGFPTLLTAPSAPPLVATPAIGFPTETGTTTTTTTKALTRAQKLAAALKACKKEPKSKRASCRKQARQRYGPVKQKSKQK